MVRPGIRNFDGLPARHQYRLDAFAVRAGGAAVLPRLTGAHGWRRSDFSVGRRRPRNRKGIALLDHKGATAKAAALKAWLAGLIAGYNDKILGLDPATAAVSGRLEASAAASGHAPGMADAIIAGIAQVHDLTVVTRNTRHFLPFGIDVSSPDAVAASA